MKPSWAVRRKVIFSTLAFCAITVGWMVFKGEDTVLNSTIANGLILLAGGVIGSYVFGAAWDDANVMKSFGRNAYREDPPPDYTPSHGLVG